MVEFVDLGVPPHCKEYCPFGRSPELCGVGEIKLRQASKQAYDHACLYSSLLVTVGVPGLVASGFRHLGFPARNYRLQV